MTFLEKAKEIIKAEGKNVSENGIIEYSCPSDYELEEAKNCVSEGRKGCEDCWNREMPNTEPKHTRAEEAIKAFQKEFGVHSENAIDKVLEKEFKKVDYEQGMNDAWELAKKIWSGKDSENVEIFGTKFVYEIYQLSPQEALAKLKAYEETQKKVEIGDIVDWLGVKAVVLDKIDEERIYLFDENGCVEEVQIYNCEKLGKQVDIKGLIEQIGE